MTLEELEKELLSDEERLTSSLEKYKSAKADLRKARITSISNKLLAPYRRFRIKVNIVKSDLMVEAIKKKMFIVYLREKSMGSSSRSSASIPICASFS